MSVSYSVSFLFVSFYICTFAKTLNIKMKVSNEIISNLKEHQSSTPSKWRENAEWRVANKSWLRYSQHIAMMMLDRMEELDITQTQLSELMECSQQYISNVLKGQEKLSLETISKIETCLHIRILS